jgi:hypothetical protein
VNVRFTADPTSRWRGDEGLQWVDLTRSPAGIRTPGIGAIEPSRDGGLSV